MKGWQPEIPENPENPDNPEKPEKPEKPENPENPEIPGIPESPESPEVLVNALLLLSVLIYYPHENISICHGNCRNSCFSRRGV